MRSWHAPLATFQPKPGPISLRCGGIHRLLRKPSIALFLALSLLLVAACGGGDEETTAAAPASATEAVAVQGPLPWQQVGEPATKVLSANTFSTGSGQYVYLVGEIENISEETLGILTVKVMGYNRQGEIFETEEAQALLQQVAPGAKAPFSMAMVSGFIDLFGWEMLLVAAGTDPVRFGQLANRYASWIQQYFDALAAAAVPVVMIHDDIVWSSGPIFRPAWYRQYVFPNYKKYLAPLLESGKRVLFCSDGNFTEFIDDLVDVGVHGFVFEPLTDLTYLVSKYGQTHVIIGNVDTRALLLGPKAKIRAEVERCLTLGRHCPGYFLAVGNHIPPNTPVEHALYYNEVYEELSRR